MNLASVTPRKNFSNWKYIEYSIAALLLIAPFYYHHNIGGEGLRIPNNITVWIVANFIAFSTTYLVCSRKELALPKYSTLLLGFPVCITISGFSTGVESPVEWLFRLLFVWIGCIFFLSLFQYKLSSGRLDRILFILVLSALIQSLTGIYQILFPEGYLEFIPGFGAQAHLPYGFFQQINNQASFQVTALLAGIYLITRPYIIRGNTWKKGAIFTVFFFTFFILSYSGQRGGPLMMALSLPFLILGRRTQLLKQKKVVILSVTIMLLGVVAGSSGIDKFIDKSVKTVEGGYSSNERLGIYSVSLDLIKESPVFGHGLGSFERVWQYQKAEFYENNPGTHLITQYVTHPHNEILFWAVEGGLISVFGMVLTGIGILLLAKAKQNYRGCSYLALIIPILIHTQVELPFYTSAIHWFVFLLITFMISHSSIRVTPINLSNPAMLTSKILSLVMLFGGTYFLINAELANRELSDKNLSVWAMPTAETNLYFSMLAESVQLKSLFLTNHKNLINGHNADLEAISTFIRWGEEFVKYKPTDQMFIYLALAYQDLKQHDKMCEILYQGLSIYPEEVSLQSGVTFCGK